MDSVAEAETSNNSPPHPLDEGVATHMQEGSLSSGSKTVALQIMQMHYVNVHACLVALKWSRLVSVSYTR